MPNRKYLQADPQTGRPDTKKPLVDEGHKDAAHLLFTGVSAIKPHDLATLGLDPDDAQVQGWVKESHEHARATSAAQVKAAADKAEADRKATEAAHQRALTPFTSSTDGATVIDTGTATKKA